MLTIIFLSLFRVRATLICDIVPEPGSRLAFCIARYCLYQLYFVFHTRGSGQVLPAPYYLPQRSDKLKPRVILQFTFEFHNEANSQEFYHLSGVSRQYCSSTGRNFALKNAIRRELRDEFNLSCCNAQFRLGFFSVIHLGLYTNLFRVRGCYLVLEKSLPP